MLRRDRASMLALFLSLLCTLLAIGLAFYYLRPPKGPDNGRCLAIALGGSSDIIGAVALALTLGYSSIVLVQPGSPGDMYDKLPREPVAAPAATPKGQQGARGRLAQPVPELSPKPKGKKNKGTLYPKKEEKVIPGRPVLVPVEASESPIAPGGNFFNNDLMLKYLLKALGRGKCPVIAAYYLIQPYDDERGSKGFSRTSLDYTIGAFNKVCKDHDVDAIVGLDFGGDVALPDPLNPEIGENSPDKPFITQRDFINLRAALIASRGLISPRFPNISSVGVPIHGIPATLVAASPGVDAAGVAPEYVDAASTAGASDAMPIDVLEMNSDGVLVKGPSLPPPVDEADSLPLPTLPDALFAKRLPSDQENRFNTELSKLTSRIIADVPAEKRHEHASKTYYMMAACHKEIRKRKETEDGSGKEERPFVALGRFRSAEKARAHLHSSSAAAVYDVTACAGLGVKSGYVPHPLTSTLTYESMQRLPRAAPPGRARKPELEPEPAQ